MYFEGLCTFYGEEALNGERLGTGRLIWGLLSLLPNPEGRVPILLRLDVSTVVTMSDGL